MLLLVIFLVVNAFAYSQRGKKKLLHNGFVYNHASKWNNATLGVCHAYDCEQRKNSHGRETVTTDDDGTIIRTSAIGHSHAADNTRAAVLQTLHQIRLDAVTSVDTKPAGIINHCVDPVLASRLSAVRNLGLSVRYARRKRLPPEPDTANAIMLHHEWASIQWPVKFGRKTFS